MGKSVTLDVREDIRRGREPFSKIMQAVAGLGPRQDLVLLAPFEPAPLYGVFRGQGFSHSSRTLESGDWEVTFSRAGAGGTLPLPSRPACAAVPKPALAVVEVDARKLEPPQPLVKIIEALADLPEGTELRARTDRRPMHLYAELDQRGFEGQSQSQADGSFVTTIRRKQAR